MTFSSAGKNVRPSIHFWRRPVIGFKIPRLRFEVRLAGLLVLLAAPGLLLTCVALYVWHASAMAWLGGLIVLIVLLASIASAVFRHIVRPLQTLSNVVAALRENEYSFRARDVGEGDALGDLAAQINELAGDLRARRHRESEAFALLERVVETMDLPVFAFDASFRLQLANPAASKLLQLPLDSLLLQSADALGLREIVQCPENSTVSLHMQGREGRWMVRRSKFYQDGIPHMLLLLSDVSGVLREQERRAWQRLIRVVAHEVNNSLTPIKSIAGSLRSRMQRMQSREPSQTGINPVDMEHGLAIIEERAESLNRFLQAYSQLAKLPPPKKCSLAIASILKRVCSLETRFPVTLTAADEAEIDADAAQLEQALINLVRNAVDAVLSSDAPVSIAQVAVSCTRALDSVQIDIQDNGPGLANPANLFIPFYTTKPGGTGIGLTLALQIIEAHGGTLTLANRADGRGCCAHIRLPVPPNATVSVRREDQQPDDASSLDPRLGRMT